MWKRKISLENWTSVTKEEEHISQNDGHDIPSASFQRRDPNAERNSTVMAPINRSQTYPEVLPLVSLERTGKLDMGEIRKSKTQN